MRDAPLISIITITLNDLPGLVYTVNSVEQQMYTNYEQIVVDGLSTDGTVEFCATTAKQSVRFSYTSEKDNGIFHAYNKGAQRARGELLVFLNSSDGLTDPSVLGFVADRWSESEDWQWGYGAMRLTDLNRVPFSGTVQAPFDRRRLQLRRQYIPHPASYVERKLFLDSGAFDESFHPAADQEFFVRVSKTHPPAVWIRFLADFMIGGISSQQSVSHVHELWHQMRVKNGVAIAGNRYVDRAASIGLAAAEGLPRVRRKLLRGGLGVL